MKTAFAPHDRVRGSHSWIPWIFVAAMLVVIAVNGCMIYLAASTWSGLSTAHPYARGLAYNRVLAGSAQQKALGWQVDVSFASRSGTRSGDLAIDLRDRAGRPIDTAEIEAVLVRPLESLPPVPVALTADPHGRYRANLDGLPRAGQWELRLSIRYGGHTLQATRRIFVS